MRRPFSPRSASCRSTKSQVVHVQARSSESADTGSTEPMFPWKRAGPVRIRDAVRLDDAFQWSFGTFSVPVHLRRDLRPVPSDPRVRFRRRDGSSQHRSRGAPPPPSTRTIRSRRRGPAEHAVGRVRVAVVEQGQRRSWHAQLHVLVRIPRTHRDTLPETRIGGLFFLSFRALEHFSRAPRSSSRTIDPPCRAVESIGQLAQFRVGRIFSVRR